MPFSFDNTFARLPEAFYARTQPMPVSDPHLIELNRDLASQLGLDMNRLESPEVLAILSGNQFADGSEPLAMAYSGHQFGGFSPQLGDGRAMLLGEVVGRDGGRRDIQLKGSGPTRFSRRGDGRSALGPVIREYIVSEAMAALGVPTTRALAAVASGDMVVREGQVPGGVFTRVAQSHIRVGTFEFFASREDQANLKILADHVISRHYPEAAGTENPYLSMLNGVVESQAGLIAHWVQFGFIHGVMNTDNMTVSGETIDYGPCAFLDEYHPSKKFSSIDHQGRYAFGNQAQIGHWNLTRFAETLLPLLDEDSTKAVALAEPALETFSSVYQRELQRRFTAKIGLEGDGNWDLVASLLNNMAEGKADFTLLFRHLSGALESGSDEKVVTLFTESETISAWMKQWRDRHCEIDRPAALTLMRQMNPVFIPRNHRVEEAIAAANAGDYEPFRRLNRVLQHPFNEQSEFTHYEAAPRPEEVVQATFCGT
ncbi:YdiU family protein [Verrucomicrobia bacterium]|jgi:serine/tyrosine/threonine adenylyltransferase|nr:YdiU family protein [Verrucomicrobiota bacterium]MDB4798317.1 YdiU family protein [Verrucomicrobiota bacterium]